MRNAVGIVSILTALPLTAGVVDRIAVTVGDQVITETEILREIAMTAFLNGDKPSFTAAEKRKAADRLVEQKLVRKEMVLGHYPAATTEQADELLAATEKRVGGDVELRSRLALYGLTPDDLERHLQWQATLVHFIDLRFRPAIQVTAADVRDYYAKEVGPKQKFADVSNQILETLSAQRADAQLDEWLAHAKTTTRIDYKQKVFE